MPKPPDESLEDAVKLLKDLVDISKTTQAISEQTFLALSYGGHAPGSTPGGGGGGGGHWHRRLDWRTMIHGPEPDLGPGYTNPRRGIGGWLSSIGSRLWKGSRTRRWMRTGGRIGLGLAKSLGLKGKARSALGRAGAAAGGAMAAGAALLVLAKAAIDAYIAIARFTESAMAEARRLSAVSGSMAAITGERDMYQMLRDVRKGEATAGSTRALMESENRRKDQESRLEIVFDNAKNSILSVLNDILADALTPIADVAEFIADNWPWGTRGSRDGPGILGDYKDMAMAASRRIEESGRTLMDNAKAASGAFPGGTMAPTGAAPRGRLP